MIKNIAKFLLRYLNIFGINPLKTIRSVRGVPVYFSEYRKFKYQLSINDGAFVLGRSYPCLGDRFEESGQARGHYFHQDLLIAQRIFVNSPLRHIDLGSRIDGFAAHVASFRQIEVLDIRLLNSKSKNIKYLQADIMDRLPDELVNCCDSLSCLHALEHFGLGRYGDPIRSDGYRIGLNNLINMLKPGGKFYLSVPIGPQRIEFNAHRVFSISHLLEMFQNRLQVDNFSFVDDHGDLHEGISLDEWATSTNCECTYGCGIFEMHKLP